MDSYCNNKTNVIHSQKSLSIPKRHVLKKCFLCTDSGHGQQTKNGINKFTNEQVHNQ